MLALVCSSCTESTAFNKCGPPKADCGEDIANVEVGNLVILRGNVRLPPEDKETCQKDQNTVTFQWTQDLGPGAELDGADQPEASFLPQEPGEYRFRCKANYPNCTEPDLCESQPDTVKVSVGPCSSPPPVADAGSNQVFTTLPGTPVVVTLDGSRSHPDPKCPGITLTHSWTQIQGPNVTIQNANQAMATVTLSAFSDYLFQLQVKDSAGTTAGRVDTDTDMVQVTLLQRPSCEASLEVSAVNALTSQPISGAQVTVVDAGGASHPAVTNGQGIASFTSLAVGNRQSITVLVPNDKVPPLPGAGGADRPRYETTTVLDHCAGQITIPLRLTASGEAALPSGTVSAKVPASIFNMLPHSWKCVGACNNDGDCANRDTHYCEQNDPGCKNLCTPRSLLPFFSLGDPNISGQFRVVILTQAMPLDNFSDFPMSRLFAKPPESAALPGNLSTDDTFLNGLGSSMGYKVWGNLCSSRIDCPDTLNYNCEKDPNEEYRCKDLNPLRNLKMEVPAGQGVRLALIVGIMDVSMADLLPILLSLLDDGSAAGDVDAGVVLGAFKLRTLHTCPITVNVAENVETNISSAMAAITSSTCWNVNYQQQEVIEPIVDTNAIRPDNECGSNINCSGNQKCMLVGNKKYCLLPMYRVRVNSENEVTLRTDLSGFDPTNPKADLRLCDSLPATATHEEKCLGVGGAPESCNPKRTCDRQISPEGTDCSFPYGLALVAMRFPPGHSAIPEGGRMIVGFNFNYTTFTKYPEPKFLIPPLESLNGAFLEANQMFFRNTKSRPDGGYDVLPGQSGTATSSDNTVRWLVLPPFGSFPAVLQLPDAGFATDVTFVPQDPYAKCDTATFERIFAVALRLLAPVAGTHNLPATVQESNLSNRMLKGVVLSQVDRLGIDGSDTLVDPWWRIYAPPGADSIPLLPDANPFSPDNEVWITPFGGDFGVQFDYDLFPNDLILRGFSTCAKDSYAVKVPP